MILEDTHQRKTIPPTECYKMLRSESPVMRPCSPAMSEISVGSPSPPPTGLGFYHAPKSFRHMHMKRLRPLHGERTRSPFPQQPTHTVNERKSNVERVKSFSIADILGRAEKQATATESPISQESLLFHSTPPQSSLTLLPTVSMLNERLQPLAPPSQLLLDVPSPLSKVLHPWDPLRVPHVLPLRPFLPPTLLHYEQRLSWDYQRQLQEHFQAQAQLLRQMSMDPTIIPSEDGSERSRSSSTGASDCCSPDVDVQSNSNSAKGDDKAHQETERSSATAKTSADSECGLVKKKSNDTPLDALFQLSTKNFDEEQDPATLNIFATRPNPKKKRKSRTAFTNHQIFELEKRFLYQKYLSPADRDEIAIGLGLSNAQVITWFQNRRAKLKRDMEELKKDVESVKQLSAHKSFLENVNDLSILKTRPVSRHHSPTSAAATHASAASTFSTTTLSAIPTAGQTVDNTAHIDSSNNNNNSNNNNAAAAQQQPRFNLKHSRG